MFGFISKEKKDGIIQSEVLAETSFSDRIRLNTLSRNEWGCLIFEPFFDFVML